MSMIATVIWKPFDARFNSLLTRMDDHQKFIMDELKIVQAKQAKKAEQAAALERVQAEKWREKVNEDKKRLAELSNEMQEIKKTTNNNARGECAISSRNIISYLHYRLIYQKHSRVAVASTICRHP
jgi:superfamily I DNA and/or RNA helicase